MVAVSVIIVNRNGSSLLDDCLGSLARQTFSDFEVVFVDNGSEDDSLMRAQALYPGVRCLRLVENTGFARGNNLGVHEAAGRYIVLLNNDTSVVPCFLEELVHAVEQRPDIGMVTPKILNFYDRSSIDSVGGLVVCRDGIAQGRGRGERDQGQYDGLQEVLMPSGCAALYRRELWDELGGFDERFFAYCEDSDLGLRAQWAGWKAFSAPRAVVYHKYSASSSKYSALKLYFVERNHYWLVLKNYPLSMLCEVPLATICRFLVMAFAVMFTKGKGNAVRTRGLWAAFSAAQIAALRGGIAAIRGRARLRRRQNSEFRRLVRLHYLSIWGLILSE